MVKKTICTMKIQLRLQQRDCTHLFSDFTKNGVIDITEGATHYLLQTFPSYWINGIGMMKVTQVGSHIINGTNMNQ